MKVTKIIQDHLIKIVSQVCNDFGECDHSVNICNCYTRGLLRSLTSEVLTPNLYDAVKIVLEYELVEVYGGEWPELTTTLSNLAPNLTIMKAVVEYKLYGRTRITPPIFGYFVEIGLI